MRVAEVPCSRASSRSTVNSGPRGSTPSAASGSTSSGEVTTQRATRFSVPISVTSNPAPSSSPTRRAIGLRPGRRAVSGSRSYHLTQPPRARWTTSHRPSPSMQTNLPRRSTPATTRPTRSSRPGLTVLRAENDVSRQRSMVWPAMRAARAAVRAWTSGSSGTGQLWPVRARSIWFAPAPGLGPPGCVGSGRAGCPVPGAGRGRPSVPTRPHSRGRHPLFRPVPAEADFTALEADELARWREHRVFERSVELRAGAEPWVFYEGPPDGQRAPRAAPRVGPGLQGPVLPLPDHAGLRRAPQGRLGHPRAPGRGRGREAARDHRPSDRSRRRSASPSSPGSAASRCATTSTSGRP